MGQTKSKTVDTRELREFAAEQYARFRDAIAEDDRPAQLAAIDEMEAIRKILEKKYTYPRLPKGYNPPNPDSDFMPREWYFIKYPLRYPAEKKDEIARDKYIYGEIDATLDKMRSQYTSQENTRQKRTFHVAKLYGIDKRSNDERRQAIQSRITKRRRQHHTPLNETLRYGYKNTTRRYMRNYENEYRNQKKPNSKLLRNTRIPTVASVAEQVAEQTVPGFSFLGWLLSFFGTTPQQPPQESEQSQPQQPQESEQSQPQQPQPSQPPQESEQSQLSQPQQSQPSTPQSTLLTIDTEIQKATVGDRKASNRLLALASDELKREFLRQYISAKNIGEPNDRDVALGNFYEELEASLRAPSSQGRYVPIPSTTEAAEMIATSVPVPFRDSGAGVFPNTPPRTQGGSRTRKHKRKHRHSK